MPGGLGRKPPKDWRHVERFPLSTEQAISLPPSPVPIGINWYVELDRPEQDSQGHWWVARDGRLTRIRGGHCVCLKPRRVTDSGAWRVFYDQGSEGACVGFGVSRAMTLLNRRRYFARWLWDRAKERDEWPETNPGDSDGTSVRAALEALRLLGHVPYSRDLDVINRDGHGEDADARARIQGRLPEGIAEYRWIRSVEDLLEVLGYQGVPYVDVLNSWGTGYPHLVRFPLEVVEKLWEQDGEFGVVTDRLP